jgi:hypothetical protein
MKNINIQHTARAVHIDDELIHIQNEKLNKIIEINRCMSKNLSSIDSLLQSLESEKELNQENA